MNGNGNWLSGETSHFWNEKLISFRFSKPSLAVQHFITSAAENISLYSASEHIFQTYNFGQTVQVDIILLEFIFSLLSTEHFLSLWIRKLPQCIVVKARRSAGIAEFWWVGFYEDHYITTWILIHLRSQVLNFNSFQFESHHRVIPVTLNVFRTGFRLSRLFLELRYFISLYFSETSVQVDMARVQGDTARHILWDMKRNVQKFKQRLQ